MIGQGPGWLFGVGLLVSQMGLRAVMLASAAAGLTACASNPPDTGPAPIDFRSGAPVARSAPVGVVMSGPVAPVQRPAPVQAAPAAAPVERNPEVVQRVVDTGVSPTGRSAIEEARSMNAEAGGRPGGALRQVRDNPRERAIEVQSGDTLYDISRRYSVNMRALIETNALDAPYALDRGDVIYLPPPNVHVVERGETLYSVSRRYNVDTRSLALLNTMQRPWTIWPGDELLLPPLAREQERAVVMAQPVVAPVVAVSAPIVAAPVKAPAPKIANDKAISLTGAKGLESKPLVETKPVDKLVEPKVAAVKVAPVQPAAPPKSTPAPVAGARDFVWPISGNVLKGFGTGADGIRNDGVNIAASHGAEVKAAAGGEVVYAGSELAGFGNLVLIRHPGGWVTAYAHSDALKVKEGDLVKQGQAIATAGKTGNAGQTQVHFELRKGKEPVDPALHLPALRG